MTRRDSQSNIAASVQFPLRREATQQSQNQNIALFKRILSEEELKRYESMPPKQFYSLCRENSEILHRKVERKPNQVAKFLMNYHQIITSFAKNTFDSSINDISLHFIIVSSHALTVKGDWHSAKQMLKKAIPYIYSTNPDPMLLATAISNLTTLRIRNCKFYKSVPLLIQTLTIVKQHLSKLKRLKQKEQLIQDTVMEINIYLLLAKCLVSIVRKNKNELYLQLLHQAYQLGIRKSVKYLGEESVFTQEFRKVILGRFELHLPIYCQKADEQRTRYEEMIMQQLHNIEELLKKQRDTPVQTVVIREEVKPKEEPRPPTPPQIKVEEPVESSEPEFEVKENNIVMHSTYVMGKWRIDAKLAKEEEQKFGTVLLDCIKDTNRIHLILRDSRFVKILSLINIYDIMPYQCALENLSTEELISYCIIGFLDFDSVKEEIQIFPRASPIISPFEQKILNKTYLIFSYHIRHNHFRLAMCPKGSSETHYLDVEVSEKFMENTVELLEETEHRMKNIYNILMTTKNSQKEMPVIDVKKINIKNQIYLQSLFEEILALFCDFLDEHIADMGQIQIFTKDKQFYKFVQLGDEFKGTFYYVRYLPHIKGFDIYLADSHETHSPHGKVKAKGNAMYGSKQFYRDFGVAPQFPEPQRFRCYTELILKKYSLKIHEDPLSTKDRQIYQQNCIFEQKITHKTFLRRMRVHGDQVVPLTASVVNLNNKYPIGLKLTGFNPATCTEVSFFIHVYAEVWKWPDDKEQESDDSINQVMEEYGYKKDYFLIEWLLRFGFKNILDQIKITQNGDFFLEGEETSLLRICKIIDRIYDIPEVK